MMGLILGIFIVCVLLLVAPFVSLLWRFFAAIAFSVFQLHLLPVMDFYLSIAFVSTFLFWPEMIREFRMLIRQKVIIILLALIAIQAISLVWSSDLRLGIRTLIYMLPFLLIVSAAYAIAKCKPSAAYDALGVACGLMLLESILVVIFRYSTDIEMAYWKSDFSGIFSNSNVIKALLDNTGRNNVLAPSKAGGFFVNANIAAAYLGIGAFIAFMAAHIREVRVLFAAAAILSSSVFFAGSKAGIILAIFLPLAAILFLYITKYDAYSRRVIVSMAVVLLVPIILIIVITEFATSTGMSTFADAVIDTVNIRLEIWQYASQIFDNSPILGQGFGGWQLGYVEYANAHNLPNGLPPHNTLIYLWSQSGLLATILGLLFMFFVLKLAYQLTQVASDNSRMLGLTLGLVSSWLFIHGMGENWGLLGEERQQILFAALLGVALAVSQQDNSVITACQGKKVRRGESASNG